MSPTPNEPAATPIYAGFWKRFAAVLIDLTPEFSILSHREDRLVAGSNLHLEFEPLTERRGVSPLLPQFLPPIQEHREASQTPRMDRIGVPG